MLTKFWCGSQPKSFSFLSQIVQEKLWTSCTLSNTFSNLYSVISISIKTRMKKKRWYKLGSLWRICYIRIIDNENDATWSKNGPHHLLSTIFKAQRHIKINCFTMLPSFCFSVFVWSKVCGYLKMKKNRWDVHLYIYI